MSLVPLLAVVFGIVAAFPVFDEWSERLQSFIFANFMPSTGEQEVPYLNAFLDTASLPPELPVCAEGYRLNDVSPTCGVCGDCGGRGLSLSLNSKLWTGRSTEAPSG